MILDYKELIKNPEKALEMARNCPFVEPYIYDLDLRILCAKLIGDLGDKEDVKDLLKMIHLDKKDSTEFEIRSNRYYRAALLEAIVKLEPKSSLKIQKILDKELEPYIVATVISLPTFIISEEDLIRWFNIKELKEARNEIMNKLATLPRTTKIEEFFIDFLINDEADNHELTKIANEVLNSKA